MSDKIIKIDDVEGKVAELLADGQVVARFKGRMEFGARALGNRYLPFRASLVTPLDECRK